ncbi:MAG: hypothetical protein MI746_02395, partial [Pseudomonadales bacterium]|nr:hypothetical protein [Pseudomonadales bacterium]
MAAIQNGIDPKSGQEIGWWYAGNVCCYAALKTRGNLAPLVGEDLAWQLVLGGTIPGTLQKFHVGFSDQTKLGVANFG